MKSRLNVIVSGLIGQYPIGGVTWDYIQYVLGLVDLGHEVTYIEDSEQWPYNPAEGGAGQEAEYNARYLDSVMKRFGLSDRWAYRFPGGLLPTGIVAPERWYGMPSHARLEALARADLLVNVSSGIGNPDRYRQVSALAYVDTDPVFTQIRAVKDARFQAHLDAHDVHFTYGECRSDAVPVTGHTWRALRKPIVLREWEAAVVPRDVFTTVMNWTSYDDVVWNGRCYGQKDKEFAHFIDLPRRVAPLAMELAIGSGITRRAPRERLQHAGWKLVDPGERCGDVDSYRSYIQSSRGEWTVAKNGYVEGCAGWFSGRTACYLAAGRPVVVQDTGFTSVLPSGQGIVTFRTMEEAVAGIRDVQADWPRHANAARDIAREYFDSAIVLSRLIDQASSTTKRADPGNEAERRRSDATGSRRDA